MIAQSVSVQNYSCFKDNWVTFDSEKRITVIIGRNNSGKSHMLDLVGALCVNNFGGRGLQFRMRSLMDEDFLSKCFGNRELLNDYLGNDNSNRDGELFLGKKIEWNLNGSVSLTGSKVLELDGSDYVPSDIHAERFHAKRMERIMAGLKGNSNTFLTQKAFRRLLADRDMVPEGERESCALQPDGRGATNIIRRHLYAVSKHSSEEKIRKDLLEALNEVYWGDQTFTEIYAKKYEDGRDGGEAGQWEIFLGEKGKGLIPLSKSGSGLKTILLVLLNLLRLMDDIKETNLSDCVFAFEELENNMHPALLRRLLAYVERFVEDNDSRLYLTTHSSVVLDYFGVSGKAQLVRVRHDGMKACAEPLNAFNERLETISELGVRPSDVLQSNVIIWVEGPSDRVYLNRWIELWSGGELMEGRHYQCVFYGGALLAQLSVEDPDAAEKRLVNLMGVNPRMVLVCDGDRKEPGQEHKPRVVRIRESIQDFPDACLWITQGREIENYIPGAILSKVLEKPDLPDPGEYEPFFPRKDGSESFWEVHADRKSFDKTEFAWACAPLMTKEAMEVRFDLKTNMEKIVERIRKWND